VVVLRTFSKAYGLAGLRIGYGFGAPELARSMWTMQLPFGMAITSAVAVAASYDADTELRRRIQLITGEHHSLRRRLRAMDIYSTDAHANFVYLPSAGQPWHEVFDPAPSSRPPLRGRRRADHDRHTGLHPCGVGGGRKGDGVARPSVRTGEALDESIGRRVDFDTTLHPWPSRRSHQGTRGY
jgi:Aminotransferase class I and II